MFYIFVSTNRSDVAAVKKFKVMTWAVIKAEDGTFWHAELTEDEVCQMNVVFTATTESAVLNYISLQRIKPY